MTTTYIDSEGNRFDVTTAPAAAYQDLDGVRGGVVFQDVDGNRVIVGRSLYASWTSTLIPEVGPLPYWSTNSGATANPTVVDRIGVLRYCYVNEARFTGARRVENLIKFTNTLTNAAWVANGTATVAEISTNAALVGPDGVVCYEITGNGTSNSLYHQLTLNGAGTGTGVLRAVPHTFSVYLRAGTVSTAVISLYVSGGAVAATATVTLNSTWQRFAITGTPDGTSTYRVLIAPGSSGTINAKQAQLEDMAGETLDASSNVPPSEYVSRDVIVYPTQSIGYFHGAMVDGVKYFPYERGNTLNNTTKLVTEASGAAIAGSTLRGVLCEPQIVNRATNSETLSGWSINGTTSLTIAASSGVSPTGVPSSAVLLTEDAASTNKYAFVTITGSTDSVQQCCQVYAKAGTRDWLRINFRNKANATIKGYYNLSTGTLGTIDSGGTAHIWPVGNGWYLCVLVATSGTGATTPEFQIGIANANGATTYTGTSGTISVWGAQCHQKEHAASYIRTAGASATRTGHALAVPMLGLIGNNDFSFYCEQYAWFDSGVINKTNDGATQDWFYPYYMRALVPYRTYWRLGQSIRPYIDPGVGYAIWAMDRYLGEPTEALKWRANTAYRVGDHVVPTDTTANNGNSRKLYVCRQAGTSGGSEPTWNTSGFPTTEQSDGTCRWQSVGPPNANNGAYDPNDGVHTYVNVAAQTITKMASWYTSAPTIGCYINGTAGIITTEPFPINQSIAGDLDYPIDELRIGRTSNSYSHSTQNTRNLMAWPRVVSGEYFSNATRV